jgi:hypothetical protein
MIYTIFHIENTQPMIHSKMNFHGLSVCLYCQMHVNKLSFLEIHHLSVMHVSLLLICLFEVVYVELAKCHLGCEYGIFISLQNSLNFSIFSGRISGKENTQDSPGLVTIR